MIVFDLKCRAGGHVFEGWFSSSADFDEQKERGLLLCPVCGDQDVSKGVMAPAVPAKGNQRSEPVPVTGQTVPMQAGLGDERMRELMTAMARAQAEALAKSEWVGKSFAEKARAMHYGEQESRPIHGEVAAQEARNLIEEGVEVAPLIFPVVPPEKQN